MAANLFIESDYVAIVDRINALQPHNRRKWGKMTLPQMLEHCIIQLKLGLGDIEPSAYEGPALMRTHFGRWLILYGMPWSRGLSTPSKMNMLENHAPVEDVETAKNTLLGLLVQVRESRSLNPHPFLGAMHQKDWGRLVWKHLDHHLKQFNG